MSQYRPHKGHFLSKFVSSPVEVKIDVALQVLEHFASEAKKNGKTLKDEDPLVGCIAVVVNESRHPEAETLKTVVDLVKHEDSEIFYHGGGKLAEPILFLKNYNTIRAALNIGQKVLRTEGKLDDMARKAIADMAQHYPPENHYIEEYEALRQYHEAVAATAGQNAGDSGIRKVGGGRGGRA